jgi:hypothetical protein
VGSILDDASTVTLAETVGKRVAGREREMVDVTAACNTQLGVWRIALWRGFVADDLHATAYKNWK